jgi:phage-related minor tail protein
MEQEIEKLVVSVRADTQGFARDIGAMRAELDGPFASGIERVGKTLENSLTRAIQTGKFGFDDLKRLALSALSEIAAASIRAGLESIAGGGQSGGSGGLLSSISAVLGSVLGAPGRATGGPVSPGRPYRVGENGPELFVPTTSGHIEAAGSGRASAALNLTINVSDNGRGSAPDALQRSSRQVARAAHQALARAGG